MTLIVKELAGVKFQAGSKVIELKGGCVMNTISDEDYKLLKQDKMFSKLVEKELIVTSNSQRAVDDTKQIILNKQTKAIESNKKANNVKLEKE